ncbi:UNVERIFIED_CONTAM: hypothetical protein FKN15_063555 [Acipenser sinensis]
MPARQRPGMSTRLLTALPLAVFPLPLVLRDSAAYPLPGLPRQEKPDWEPLMAPLSARRLTTFLLSAGKLLALPPEAEEWQVCATPLSALLLTALQPVDPLKLLFLAQDYYRDFWAFKGEVAVEAMCAVHKGGVICGYSGARDKN